jgi:hypothetical protein
MHGLVPDGDVFGVTELMWITVQYIWGRNKDCVFQATIEVKLVEYEEFIVGNAVNYLGLIGDLLETEFGVINTQLSVDLGVRKLCTVDLVVVLLYI